MQSPWPYFSYDELYCKCGSCTLASAKKMCPTFMEHLITLRQRCGFAFLISSAYRCEIHPAEIHKEKGGSHTTGKAIDIRCAHSEALKILEAAQKMGVFTGIGIQQKGNYTTRFVHLDSARPSPKLWSY